MNVKKEKYLYLNISGLRTQLNVTAVGLQQGHALEQLDASGISAALGRELAR